MRAAFLCCALLLACHDPPAAPADAAPEASSPASHPSFLGDPNDRPGGNPPPHVAAPPMGPQKCRIMDADDGPPPNADPANWLELTHKGTFNVRVFETGREIRFVGPGRFRGCGGDVALVAEGSAIGLPGSGEAPGSEQWVATACGAARWASGVHRFTGARDTCNLHVSTGVLDFWLPTDITPEDAPIDGGVPDAGPPVSGAGWHHIATRRAFSLHGKGPLDTPAAVKASLAECDADAIEVESLAKRMATAAAGATGELGTLAGESVTRRGTARAACAVAAVRVALGGDKPDDRARLAASNARFRASP